MTVTQKDTLVFGASLKSESYSNLALKKLRSSGIETKAFGLTNGTVYGVEIDISLKLYKNIHTVTLYLNPKHQKAYYDYLIESEPQRVILIRERKIQFSRSASKEPVFLMKFIALWFYFLRINTNPKKVSSPLSGRSS